jgi:hypothetical protein
MYHVLALKVSCKLADEEGDDAINLVPSKLPIAWNVGMHFIL